ncbi:MAG TPA: alpha/beta fold hydrolase [Kineosporiaceae bacterium]
MHRSSSAGGERRPRSRLVRWIVGVVVTLLVLGVIAVGAIGWYFSGVALAIGSHQPDYTITVRGVSADGAAVELSNTLDSRRPEPAGLEWDGGYGQVGAILGRTSTSVTRAFTALVGRPTTGLAVSVDPYDYPGDPRTALGLAYQDLSLPGELGALPTWYLPAERGSGSWAVFVHGHDGSRRESLRYLALLHARGLPVLVPSYRNDAGAPRSPDGQDHLGDTEWRDLEPAMRYALAHGARDVVLFGWSMGGAVSLQFADRSALRDHVRGLVLDSPVLDWRDTLTHQARLRGLPDPVTAVAEWLVGARLGTGLDRFDWVARAGELRRPVLLVHSDADGYVPDGPSHALAQARPDLVTFLDIPGADHTRGWNVDPQRYRVGLEAWLSRQGV